MVGGSFGSNNVGVSPAAVMKNCDRGLFSEKDRLRFDVGLSPRKSLKALLPWPADLPWYAAICVDDTRLGTRT